MEHSFINMLCSAKVCPIEKKGKYFQLVTDKNQPTTTYIEIKFKKGGDVEFNRFRLYKHMLS